MGWQERIVIDPAVAHGKPVVRGTRLVVTFTLDLLAHGWTEAEILENYPTLQAEDLRACLAYAADALEDETVLPIPA